MFDEGTQNCDGSEGQEDVIYGQTKSRPVKERLLVFLRKN
jgi:hypothetical protein